MEGLLPLVFKAIKKNRTRRQYECLSSGGAASLGGYNINMAEIHPQNLNNQTNQRFDYDNHHHHDHDVHGAAERSSSSGPHRRHKSVEDFGNGFHSPQMMMRTGGVVGSASSPKQLMRFRSQRMFSCITGS